MSSMHSVTIDSGIIAIPQSDCSHSDVYDYVDMLLDWSKLLEENWVAIYMSERASEVLLENELYPHRKQLKALFSVHGIVEYDVNTIVRIPDRLLAITPSFETYFGLKDILADPVETEPDIIGISSYTGLQSDLARCIILISLLRKHCHINHTIILRKAPKQKIRVHAQIYTIDHTRDDIPSLPCPPNCFEGDVLVCDNFRGLLDCLDEVAVLSSTIDDTGVDVSIRIALYKYKLALGEEAVWSELSIPIIGNKFLTTCHRCFRDRADSLPMKTLRSIIEIITSKNMTAVHALRINAGGNAPQKMRGMDKAFRRDIDREFHLHYWECDDGTIELASVVYHNDFSIPE